MSLEQKVKSLEAQLAQALKSMAQLQERIRELEAQLAKANKNSGNSAKPPSSDITKPPTGGGRSASPRKIGGQPGHPRHERPAFPPEQVDERQIHGLKQCPDGGSRHLEVLSEPAQRFGVLDRRATRGTRSHKGRTFCERIWTVVGNCRRNKRSIFENLCQARTAWAGGLPIPSLIPANSS